MPRRRVRTVARIADPQTEAQVREIINVINGDSFWDEDSIAEVLDRDALDYAKPGIPQELQAFPGFGHHVLTWDAAYAAYFYVLSYSTRLEGGAWSAWLSINVGNTRIFSHNGLDFELEFRYRVAAHNRDGVSGGWSEIVEAGKPGKLSISEQVIADFDRVAIWDRAQEITAEGKFLAEKIEGDRAEIWDRSEEITAQGKFLAEKIEGVLATENVNYEPALTEVLAVENKLNSEDQEVWYSSVSQTAEEIDSVVLTLGLDAEHEMQFSSIKQTAEEINSVVGTLELDAEHITQYSSIKQTAEGISSVVATLDLDAEHVNQYSSIKQTAEEIDSVVSTLDLDAEHVEQYSSIRQTAEGINSVVATLELDAEHVNQYSSVKQTAEEISQTVATLDGDTGAPGQFSSIVQLAEEISSTVARLDGEGAAFTTISQNAEQITFLAADTTDHGDFISAFTQTPEEISSTVAEVYPDGTGQQSTIQQQAESINLRVTAVNELGNPVPSAQIQIGHIAEGTGYITLNADDVLIPGTLHANKLIVGTIETDRIVSSGITERFISSQTGTVTTTSSSFVQVPDMFQTITPAMDSSILVEANCRIFGTWRIKVSGDQYGVNTTYRYSNCEIKLQQRIDDGTWTDIASELNINEVEDPNNSRCQGTFLFGREVAEDTKYDYRLVWRRSASLAGWFGTAASITARTRTLVIADFKR